MILVFVKPTVNINYLHTVSLSLPPRKPESLVWKSQVEQGCHTVVGHPLNIHKPWLWFPESTRMGIREGGWEGQLGGLLFPCAPFPSSMLPTQPLGTWGAFYRIWSKNHIPRQTHLTLLEFQTHFSWWPCQNCQDCITCQIFLLSE